MFTLTTIGETHYLQSLKDAPLYFAYGVGSGTWGTAGDTGLFTPDESGEVGLGHNPVSSVVVKRNGVTMTEGVPENPNDYSVDYANGIVRIFPPLLDDEIEWQVTYRYGIQAEDPDDTALLDEKFCKAVASKQFVTPDEDGPITVGAEKFSGSETPTRFLLCEQWIEPGEAITPFVRELGVFAGRTVNPEAGAIVAPAQVLNQGYMIIVAHFTGVYMSATTRTRFRHLIKLPEL